VKFRERIIMNEASEGIDKLSEEINTKLEKIITNLKGQRLKDISAMLESEKFEMNPTKRAIIVLLEGKLASVLNEQFLK
jgi:hypothetical protein